MPRWTMTKMKTPRPLELSFQASLGLIRYQASLGLIWCQASLGLIWYQASLGLIWCQASLGLIWCQASLGSIWTRAISFTRSRCFFEFLCAPQNSSKSSGKVVCVSVSLRDAKLALVLLRESETDTVQFAPLEQGVFASRRHAKTTLRVS